MDELISPFVFSDEDLQGWQIRLAMICQSCPVHSRHPDFCPMHDVAKLKPSKQIDFIQSLPAEVLRYALIRHEVCMEHEVENLLRSTLISCDASTKFVSTFQTAGR